MNGKAYNTLSISIDIITMFLMKSCPNEVCGFFVVVVVFIEKKHVEDVLEVIREDFFK